ncbi:MAG: ATP-binding protein [Oscillospiraceae bacterium]|nr:ATP-binding protein [Oscillospiraceae bacterium]
MSIVHLTCGKICSGKSYLAAHLAKKENALILSVDELMLTLHAQCLGDKHKEAETGCLEYLLQKAAEASALGVNVIIDYGFFLRNERAHARQFFQNQKITVKWHYLQADNATRKQRLLERNKKLTLSPKREHIITPEMMERFDSGFEELLPFEVPR